MNPPFRSLFGSFSDQISTISSIAKSQIRSSIEKKGLSWSSLSSSSISSLQSYVNQGKEAFSSSFVSSSFAKGKEEKDVEQRALLEAEKEENSPVFVSRSLQEKDVFLGEKGGKSKGKAAANEHKKEDSDGEIVVKSLSFLGAFPSSSLLSVSSPSSSPAVKEHEKEESALLSFSSSQEEEDQILGSMSATISNLLTISSSIQSEFEVHKELLKEQEEENQKAENLMQQAEETMRKWLRKSRFSPFCIVLALSVIALLLFFLVLFT